MADSKKPVVDADAELLERLRAGDEDAFMTLVDRYGPLMLRIALTHVRTRAVAEEVVQEAWLGVLQGLDRFEGRSSLKTWILRIVANQARTRGEREARKEKCRSDHGPHSLRKCAAGPSLARRRHLREMKGLPRM